MNRTPMVVVAAAVLAAAAGCSHPPTGGDADRMCETSVAAQVPTTPDPQFHDIAHQLLDTRWVVKGTVDTVDTFTHPISRPFTCLLRVDGDRLVPEGTEVD